MRLVYHPFERQVYLMLGKVPVDAVPLEEIAELFGWRVAFDLSRL